MSMGWGAGRKLGQVLDHVARVVAVEVLCAVRGIELRAPLRPSPAVESVVAHVREIVPPLTADRPIGPEIEVVAGLVEEGLAG